MNAAARASYRNAAELADADSYYPEPTPAIVRDRCTNCGAFTSARVAEWTDPDGDLWLGYGCKYCGSFDPVGLFDRRGAVAAGVVSEEGDDDVPF